MGGASFVPDLEAWEPWRPDEVGAALGSMHVPWAVAGGWAIDLHVQAETRPHDDIEIVVSRDQMEVVAACLDELDWFGVGNGRAWPLADAPEGLHQTWGRDRALTLPLLTRNRIEWLQNALEVVHPKHEWTARLDTFL